MMKFDSPEEKYFYDWLTELKAKGFVDKVIAEPKYNLLDPVEISVKKQLKASTKEDKLSLMQGLTYKADFLIIWKEEVARGIFCFCEEDVIQHKGKALKAMLLAKYNKDNNLYSVVDIKGTFAARHNSTTIKFPLLQKILYHLHGVFVQKVMPLHKTSGLFALTFTTQSYWYTEKKKQLRKTQWEKRSLADYLAKLKTSDANK